jgi:hypothetical protein
MFPITVGTYTYRIVGKKGHIVNWLAENGTQLIKIDDAPAFSRFKLVFTLYEPEKSVGETMRAVTTGLAGKIATGPAKDLLSLAGGVSKALSAYDAVEEYGESSDGFRGKTVKHYVLPSATAKKILDINVVVPGNADSALKNVKTNIRNTNFSTLAAWMFGS